MKQYASPNQMQLDGSTQQGKVLYELDQIILKENEKQWQILKRQ